MRRFVLPVSLGCYAALFLPGLAARVDLKVVEPNGTVTVLLNDKHERLRAAITGPTRTPTAAHEGEGAPTQSPRDLCYRAAGEPWKAISSTAWTLNHRPPPSEPLPRLRGEAGLGVVVGDPLGNLNARYKLAPLD